MAIDRDKVVQAALKFAEKKRYDKAIAEYQKIIQEDPNDARTLLKIGDLQLKMEAYQAAIDTYERVGKHYATQGFSLKAIAVYKQIRDIIARHVPALEDRYGHILPKLAEIYTTLGLTSDALAAYDEVASKLLKSGKDKDAITVFKRIVELDPTNPLPHLRLAEALARAKDVDGAIEQFSMAADILLKLSRRDDALKVVDRLLQIRPDPAFAKRAAQLYLERAQNNDGLLALAKLQVAFQANPKDLETLGLLARAFEQIGQKPKAIEVQKEAARLAKEQGNHEVFQQLITHLARVAPDDDQVRSMMRKGGSSVASVSAHAVRDTSAASVSVSAAEVDVDEIEYEESLESEQPFALARQSHRPPSGDVQVEESLEAVEDLHEHDRGIDSVSYERQAIADAHAFRGSRLPAKAVETLRIALEVLPGSIALRGELRDVLLEMGDRQAAVGEMITLAAIAIDRNDVESAVDLLSEILLLVPTHVRAQEMLASLGYEMPGVGPGAMGSDVIDDRTSSGVEYGDPSREAFETYDPEQPLPSYDLEEVGAGGLLGVTGEPPRAALLETDDPFADPVAATTGGSPLPTFQMDEDEPFAGATDDGSPPGSAPMLGGTTRAFQGGDSIEDALEEIEFFSSRGLHEDARAILDEQLARAPTHPLLLEKLRELSEAQGGGDVSGERPLPPERTQVTPMGEAAFDLGASLDALDDAFEPIQEAQSHFAKVEEQVDVEAVFAKFKEGVKAQVSDTDSQTHYDLGVAYKEMGLIADSLSEFRVAANDPKRACVCMSMVGVIELERNNLDAAAEAFIEALHAEHRTVDQELSLYYELGAIFEAKQVREEALYYFRKIERKDPEFRDVQERIRALGGSMKPSNTRSLANDEDFDAVFDDILAGRKLPN